MNVLKKPTDLIHDPAFLSYFNIRIFHRSSPMEHPRNLSELLPGQSAEVRSLQTVGPMRRRLLDLGLIEHTEVMCLGKSPLGDPSAYLIRGAVIAIRAKDSRQILINIKQT